MSLPDVKRFAHGSRVPGWDEPADLTKADPFEKVMVGGIDFLLNFVSATAFDPATDYRGRKVRAKRTTEEKLEAARARNVKRYGDGSA